MFESESSRSLNLALAVTGWLGGIALSSGFWQSTAAVCIPPYSWYLTVKQVMHATGLL